MNRKVTVVLMATFLALVAGTLWVPARWDSTIRLSVGATEDAIEQAVEWDWVWRAVVPPRRPERVGRNLHFHGVRRIVWAQLSLQLCLIVAAGGLLALAVHVRAARAAA